MKKNFFLLVFFVILASIGFSQILYKLQINGSPSCAFKTDNDETIVGISSISHMKLIKINKDGIIIDSMIFDDTSMLVRNIIKTEQPDHYLALASRSESNIHSIVICKFNDNFNILWEKTIDVAVQGSIHSIGGQFLDGYYYIYISQSPTENEDHFYKINTEGEVVDSAIHQEHYNLRFMTHIPNTDSFIINKHDTDLNLDVINTDLEKDTSFRYAITDVLFPNLKFINDTIFVTSGMGTEGYGYNYQDRIVIKATNFNEILGNIYAPFEMTVFGTEGIGGYPWYPACRVGERESLAMHDDYFFFAGTGLFNNSYGPPYDTTDNFIMIYAFDHNLDSLWAMHLGYDAYYHTWYIVPTVDGGCVVVARRYDWRVSGNIETYIVRIEKPDFPIKPSIPQNVQVTQEENELKVFVTWEVVMENNVEGYNVYRNDEKLNLDIIPETEYWNNVPSIGNYCYQVTAVVKENESEKSEPACINVTIVGISETGKNALFILFPNPGNNQFLLQTELVNFTLQLYDLQGQLLLTQQNRKEVNTEELPSGCYIYRVISDNGEAMNGKWVKE